MGQSIKYGGVFLINEIAASSFRTGGLIAMAARVDKIPNL
jgi:hypothetical protein